MESNLAAALADDLDQLIRLHDREIDVETLAALKATDFPAGLALQPDGEMGRAACDNMVSAMAGPLSLDELAADFAAIYLNNSLGASPYESVWLSDDHLACAAPMFELRERYAAIGLQVTDWRRRFDDHIVFQLQYIRHVLLSEHVDSECLAGFIDEHLGYWFPDFASRVSMYCDTAFYAALMELTHVWLLRLRGLVGDIYDLPVPSRETMTERINRKLALDKAEVAPIKFMPGVHGPSW
ncbi:molecular chaperone [Azonexus sp.]|uniref:TorD/DmsD family molecular chaperone n=1 Tax=Azonexus sp. TaxID=1872668 RepID=UPI0035B184CC